MPRYHFDVSIGDVSLPDPEGRDLPDADAAWETAKRMAGDLMRSDLGPAVNWMRGLVVVRDEADEIVLEFPFAEAVQAQPPLH